jgi:hypothetical protein
MMLRARHAAAVSLLFLISLGSCARQPSPPHPSDGALAKSRDQATLPFGVKPAYNDGISPTASFVPAAQNLPAGTPFVVRLQSSLSSASARTGDTFKAVLDEPILVDGKPVLPAGTPVVGVIAGHKAGSDGGSSYLRLTVTALEIRGGGVRVESSSISAKAASSDQAGKYPTSASGLAASPIPHKRNVEFGSQRRLTFRLTAPLELAR